MHFKLFLDSERLAWRANKAKTLWQAGKKFGVGAFIKPLNSPTRYPEYNAFFELIESKTGVKDVLDVGSPKLFPLLLAERLNANIYSTDIWDVPIQEAKALAGGLSAEARKRLVLDVSDIRKPLPPSLTPHSGKFDLAFAMSVIEHIEPNPGGDILALQSLHRLVRPDGSVIVSIPVAQNGEDEYSKETVYGKENQGEKNFFQRVYDTGRIENLLSEVEKEFSLEKSVLIEWPKNLVFKSFWSITNTKIRGLLGPTFPFFGSGFEIKTSSNVPLITGPGDIVLSLRRL